MTTTVINLIGGPGCGKSTLAAELYAHMKQNHMKVEMVREVAKEWAWEGRKIGAFEQLSILGEQIKKESSLFHKVEYIITDSPVLLGAFYLDWNHNQTFMNKPIVDYYQFGRQRDVKCLNYVLPRNKKYDANGRYETEDVAKELDLAIVEYLDDYDYQYTDFRHTSYDNKQIIQHILKDVL